MEQQCSSENLKLDSSPCFNQKLFVHLQKPDETEGSPFQFFGTVRLFLESFSTSPFNFLIFYNRIDIEEAQDFPFYNPLLQFSAF